MSTNKNFRLTTIIIALAAAFPIAGAYADDVDKKLPSAEVVELTSPDVAQATVKLQYLNDVNPLYRQYNGMNNDGINGSVDIDYVKRSETGDWLKARTRDLGLTTQELGASYEKQGNWSVGIDYNQIPRYAPYEVSTAVSGIGSNTITQPSYPNTAFSGGALSNPALSTVTLKTERDITTFTASKFLAKDLKLGFSFKNEDKTGTRMDGVRGVSGTGSPNLYSGFLFSPEPIDQNHKQFEATLEYMTSKYQLTAGYYGSFLNTNNNALTVVPGTNTALVNSTLSPIALAPDNQAQQFYLNGGYNFSKDTRGTLKLAYSEASQTDGFLSGQPTDAGIGSDLGGKVKTNEVFASLTSHVTTALKLLGTWRYEDKQDKTPVRTFYTGYANNPESHTANWGKLEADYNLGAGYGLTGGVDYNDKKSAEWERNKVKESTARLALRKTMSETVNGTLSVAHSERNGSDWGAAAVPLYPVFMADRKRDKVRAMIDWSAVENLNLQFAYESYSDDYSKSTYGLESGEGQIFSLDGSYVLNDNWKINAWYSAQDGKSKQSGQGAVCTDVSGVTTCASGTTTFRTGTLIQWDANLKSNSDQIGFGILGKIKMVDVGAQFLYSEDKNSQKYGSFPATTCLNAACTTTGTVSSAIGILPDTKYTQNTLKLNATYSVSKATKLRLDYVYDVRKMDDYTWSNWVYADGTKVFVKPDQTTQILGLSVTQSF